MHVSCSIDMNIWGPSHLSLTVLYTNTLLPSGSFSSNPDFSPALGDPVIRFPKSIFLRACSICTYFMAFSIAWLRCYWVGDGVDLAGRGKAPNTKRVGQSPSGVIIFFTAKTAMRRHSSLLVSRRSSLLRFMYAIRRGQWYHSTVPMHTVDPIGAYTKVISSVSHLC